MNKVRYPVKAEAIREIQEEIHRSKTAWRNIKMLKPVFIDIKYYEFIRGAKVDNKNLN